MFCNSSSCRIRFAVIDDDEFARLNSRGTDIDEEVEDIMIMKLFSNVSAVANIGRSLQPRSHDD